MLLRITGLQIILGIFQGVNFVLPFKKHVIDCSSMLQSFTRMGQSPSMMRRRQLSFKSVTKRPLKAWLCTLKKGRSSRECVASEEMVKLGINPFIPDELILTRFLRGP